MLAWDRHALRARAVRRGRRVWPVRAPRQPVCLPRIVPSENTTGQQRRQGSITKAGSTHARRLLIEAAYHYQRHPAIGLTLKRRQRGQSPEIVNIAWRAQRRLHARWRQLKHARKKPNGIVARLSRNSEPQVAVGTEVIAVDDRRRRRQRSQPPGLDCDGGELVAVELGEVVGCHQQSPFGPHRDPASSVKSGDQPVVLGVCEHGLDHLDSLAVELFAVL